MSLADMAAPHPVAHSANSGVIKVETFAVAATAAVCLILGAATILFRRRTGPLYNPAVRLAFVLFGPGFPFFTAGYALLFLREVTSFLGGGEVLRSALVVLAVVLLGCGGKEAWRPARWRQLPSWWHYERRGGPAGPTDDRGAADEGGAP